MDNKTTGGAMLVLTCLAGLLGMILYPSLPEQIVTHVSMSGQVDGFGSSFLVLLFFPWLLIATFLLWFYIPRIEPMQKNFKTFRHAYNGFFLVLSIFIFYTFILMVGLSIGWVFNFVQALAPGVALLFAAVGILLEHTRRNYLVGIRTPWTLSSDKIWKRTNLLGSRLFYMCAAWALAGATYPEYFAYYILVPILFTIVATTYFSFVEFKRQTA